MTAREGSPQKLMDLLIVQEPADPMVGFLATTFELQTDFLETDYLPALFSLGSWDDQSWASRVALHGRLASLESATLFQSAERFRGRPRSLWLEVVPVPRAHGRVLHAKVTLVVHEGSVRLLVASANLTEPGYRRNREVGVLLWASAKKPAQAALIRACLRRMPEALREHWTEGAGALVASAMQRLDVWLPDDPAEQDEWFHWGGLDDPLWRSFTSRWPEGEEIQRVTIVSPFWSAQAVGGPIERFVQALVERGALASSAELRLISEAQQDAEHAWRPVLPVSYGAFDTRRLGLRGVAMPVDPTVSREEAGGMSDERPRSLHAKVVLVEGRRTSLAYFGSANFTRRGWGFFQDERAANIEAGLIVRRTGRAREALAALVPPTCGVAVPLEGIAGDRIAPAAPIEADRVWPAFVRRVYLTQALERAGWQDLALEIAATEIEGPWAILLDVARDSAVPDLLIDGSNIPSDFIDPVIMRVSLSPEQHRRLVTAQHVLVRWWGSEELIEFPINVDQQARGELPLSPESGRPNERLLLQYYQSRIAFEDLFPPPPGWEDEAGSDSAPALEAEVDTSSIQSYQIREFVEALRGIRDDLAQATGTPAAMRLAVLGEVSPVALGRAVAKAVTEHARTPVAGAFQLVEILACVGQAASHQVPERHRDRWMELLGQARALLDEELERLRAAFPAELGGSPAFQRYERAVRGLVTTMEAA